jgi:hypothetical protein
MNLDSSVTARCEFFNDELDAAFLKKSVEPGRRLL